MNLRRLLRVVIVGQHNSLNQVLATNIQCWGYEALILPSLSAFPAREEEVGGDIVLYDLDEAFRISVLAGGRDTPTLPPHLATLCKVRWPQVSFTIALSSHSVSRITLEHIGAIALLQKPFEMGQLQRYLHVLQKLLLNDPRDATTVRITARLDASRTNARVLVVEDHNEVAEAIRQTLVEEAGYEVAVAYDGLDAIEQCLSWRPHCIITDLIMPWMNGYQLMRCLAAGLQPRSLAFIVMSALTEVEAPVNQPYLKDAPVLYIDKPFRIEHLLATVEQALQSVGVHLAAPQPVMRAS